MTNNPFKLVAQGYSMTGDAPPAIRSLAALTAELQALTVALQFKEGVSPYSSERVGLMMGENRLEGHRRSSGIYWSQLGWAKGEEPLAPYRYLFGAYPESDEYGLAMTP